MYVGFNLKDEENTYKKYCNGDMSFLHENNDYFKKKLDQYIKPDNSLDGTILQEAWFPDIECDIFLSHSHKDIENAEGLACWLYKNFKLKTFIDSFAWSYCDDLLKDIDDHYCKNKSTGYYCYKDRNISTSHVHMMLSIALDKMIDNTECLMFLNSPQSIICNGSIRQTGSPWIYKELVMSKLIRRKTKEEHRKQINLEKSILQESHHIDIKYLVELDHLDDLTPEKLNDWKEVCCLNNYEYNLDALYSIMNVRDDVFVPVQREYAENIDDLY